MHKITQKIIIHIHSKNVFPPEQWHIGFSDDIEKTIAKFQKPGKIVCEYVKTYSCKNKIKAKEILEELSPFGFSISNKTHKNYIFVFLEVDKATYKFWKNLNPKRPKERLILS